MHCCLSFTGLEAQGWGSHWGAQWLLHLRLCAAVMKPHTSLRRENVSACNGTEVKKWEATKYFLSDGEEAWEESTSAVKGKSDSANLFKVLLLNPIKQNGWGRGNEVSLKAWFLSTLILCHLRWPIIIWLIIIWLLLLLINQSVSFTWVRKLDKIISFNFKTLVRKKFRTLVFFLIYGI